MTFILFPPDCTGDFAGNQVNTHTWVYFQTLYSVSLIDLSVFVPIAHRIILVNKILDELLMSGRLVLQFHSPSRLTILDILLFSYKFFKSLLNFYKKPVESLCNCIKSNR